MLRFIYSRRQELGFRAWFLFELSPYRDVMPLCAATVCILYCFNSRCNFKTSATVREEVVSVGFLWTKLAFVDTVFELNDKIMILVQLWDLSVLSGSYSPPFPFWTDILAACPVQFYKHITVVFQRQDGAVHGEARCEKKSTETGESILLQQNNISLKQHF